MALGKMMGLEGNPLYSAFDSRRNALMGIGAGLLSGNWGNMGRYAMEGRQMDDAYATAQKAEAERQGQLNQTVQAMLAAGREDLANMAEAGQMDLAWKTFVTDQSAGKGADAPANVREWQYYSGLSPDDQAAYLRMKRTNPYLDIGTGFVQPDPVNPGMTAGPAIVKNGDVPTGYQQVGGGAIAPMPGSEQDIEATGRRIKADSAMATLEQKNAVALQAVDAALDQANWSNTGNVMGNSGWVPWVGQGATDLARTLDTIKANIGFEELQTMRDNSPTGGALGQVTERELAFLQSTIASIEQAQSEDQLKRNLQILRDFIAQSQARRRAAYDQQYGGAVQPSGQGGSGAGFTVIGVE